MSPQGGGLNSKPTELAGVRGLHGTLSVVGLSPGDTSGTTTFHGRVAAVVARRPACATGPRPPRGRHSVIHIRKCHLLLRCSSVLIT